ncbi:chemotaxis protein CheW, partial [bacterium]|nr:chemotaxis protein CheW [bacterium]
MDLSSTTDPTERPAPTAGDGETDGGATERQSVGETLQFVTFTVAEEAYAVDIMQVREIKAWSEVTRLPNQPEYMRGVLNLR